MFARVGEAVMVGVTLFAVGGDAVAPGEGVGFGGGSDRGAGVVLVAFDLGEDVEGVGVEKGARAAFREVPDLVEEFAGGHGFSFAAVEFGEGDESGKFFFD